MRIPNLTMSDALVARLNNLNVGQSKYNDQLSNGQRITLASEDAPAASRVLRLQSEKSSISVFNTNGDRALSIAQASYAALGRLKDFSDRATELATLAAGDTVSAAERTAYSVEVRELIQSAIDAANTTYQGEYLFNGFDTDSSSTVPYSDAGTFPFTLNAPSAPVSSNSSLVAGNPEVTVSAGNWGSLKEGMVVSGPGIPQGTIIQSKISLGNKLVLSAAPSTTNPTASLTFSADGPLIQLSEKVSLSPFNTGAANAQVGDFIRKLAELYDALKTDSSSGVTAAKSSLLNSEEHLVSMLADNASIQSRIESLRIQNAERVHNMDSLVSREIDVDTAQTMVNLTRARVSYQAAMEAGAQVLKLSLLDYIR